MRKALLSLLAVGCIAADNSSNWGSPLIPVNVPSAITSAQQPIHALGSPGDGFAYVGSGGGIYRALWSCIEADPSNVNCWTALNTGIPKPTKGTTDPYLDAREFDFIDGTVYVVFYNAIDAQESHICHWNGSAWIREKRTPAAWLRGTSSGPPLYITHDPATGSIYAGSYGIWISTDHGATWSESPSRNANAYSRLGYKAGVFYNTPRVRVFNGVPNLFWGGEGSLISQPLNFSSHKSWTPTANGGCTYPNCFAHNMRGLETDGDPGAGGAIIVLINHCTAPGNQATSCTTTNGYITRSTDGGTTWVDPANVDVPDGNTHYWTMRNIARGAAAHEFYVVGGGGQYAGILGSVDGGATWRLVGQAVPASGANGGSFANVAINSDDAKLVSRPGGGGTPAGVYFHPAPER